MVKTPEEMERLKTVGLRNERCVQKVLGRLEEGVSEEDLTQLFLESVAQEGAVFEFWALFEKYVIDHFSGVIHRGVERGEILAPARNGAGGRPEGQNLVAIVAPCG